MVKKIAKTVSIIILILAGLSLFGYYIRKVLTEDSSDPISKAIKEFVSMPDKVTEVVESNEIRNVPPTFEMERHFPRINNLKRDVFALNSFYDTESKEWEIKLFNIRNDSVLYSWRMHKDLFVRTTRLYPNSEPRNPILLPDRNIIADNDESKNLYRLDAESNVVWHNTDKVFHHAMNLGADGNIWICSTKPRVIEIPKAPEPRVYEDEFLTKVNIETGEIIFDRSLSDILISNGYRNFIYGCTNRVEDPQWWDPMHLNDIEPIMNDGPYWKKGDLLLSLRHRSLVMLYRPSSNKILRLIFGPFLSQHDVDVLDDKTISIFDNESTSIGMKPNPEDSISDMTPVDTIDYARIVHYHFEDSSFTTDLEDHFNEHHIYTDTQGFHQYLSDGLVYVEQHNRGIIFLMNEDTVVYKSQGTNRIPGWVERPHWMRIYENIDL